MTDCEGMHRRRMGAQASLEFLIVAAALVAFLMAFVPAVQRAQESAGFAMTRVQMEFALGRISGMLQEAARLGEGMEISEGIYLPFPAEMEIGGGRVFLKWELEGGWGAGKNVEAAVGPAMDRTAGGVSPETFRLAKGTSIFTAVGSRRGAGLRVAAEKD